MLVVFEHALRGNDSILSFWDLSLRNHLHLPRHFEICPEIVLRIHLTIEHWELM
jgi:hypothetical protein